KYFTENKKNEIIIAQKLAERLKLKIRKKLVLQFQNAQGDIVAGSFRIVGLFSTANTLYDESFVMIRQTDLNRLLVLPNASHEIAVFLDDSKELAQVKSDLQNQFPHLLIEDYKEISPDANLYESQMEVSHRIFITIFMLALIFGIINTMLMAVLERNKELGMLMALGMNKTRVFFMIVFETLMLGIIALPFGLILSWLSITYFGKHGVDLSAFSDGMEQFGMSTLIKSYIPTELYFSLSTATVFTALLASIYPAIKAINLKPIEAMRKI
ncbi:MAG: FtsX-like permease family protein, partial [Saprospiraceae bacterium]|nr:FtsX-like permease family protein [Saprospiraceae bacterium]